MATDLPLVSILVPVYQVENYIERCARSLFEQTYDNLEYIFVDDGSPDRSISVLEETLLDYPHRKPHTKIIRHPQNKGIAATRNTAVAESSGMFLFHVDSDDWVEPNAIELLVNKQLETNADIVTGQACVHRHDVEEPYLSGGWNLDRESLLVHLLKYQVSTTLWRRLIRKSLYTDHAIQCDETGSGGEDYQILPRLVYYAKVVSGIDVCIYHYNKSNKASITNSISSCLDTQIQGYVSVSVISSFFSDKETYLQKIVKPLKVKNLHYRLLQNIRWKNKEGHKLFATLLLQSDKDCWHYIGWNHPLKRLIESHYSLIRIVIPFLQFFNMVRRQCSVTILF